MIEITIVALIFIEIYTWIKYKDLRCPALLHNIMWIVAIPFSGQFIFTRDLNSIAFGVIIIGAIVF